MISSKIFLWTDVAADHLVDVFDAFSIDVAYCC
jgi:hypothetical protein